MAELREMLKAGAHFGHQRQKWNPKMAPYIFTERNNIHIINLEKTMELIEKAKDFVRELGTVGETLFLVGTKRQAQDVIKEEAEKAGLPYVNYRWLGGMLTNFTTINNSVKKLQKFEEILTTEKRRLYKKKEIADLEKKKAKLEKNLSGILKMEKAPGAIFIVDPIKERLALHEAKILGIPIIAIIDTNGDPEGINFLIPANDDGMRCISLITSDVVAAYMEGYDVFRQKIVAEQKDKKEKSSRGETRVVAGGRRVKVKRFQTSEHETSDAAAEEDDKADLATADGDKEDRDNDKI